MRASTKRCCLRKLLFYQGCLVTVAKVSHEVSCEDLPHAGHIYPTDMHGVEMSVFITEFTLHQ